MCIDCGCSDGATATMTNVKTGEISDIRRNARGEHHAGGHRHSHDHELGHGHHHHGHAHSHVHDHGSTGEHTHPHASVVTLQQSLLEKNDALAARNRAWLAGREVLMLNLVSSPGSGKTSLLERTIRDLHAKAAISVIEGDQATVNDGARIDAAGAPAIQVNTGTGCHLEADMIERALGALKPRPGSMVFVENVGNLVCPSLFDLGEKAKVAILSVTEGEDKPLKYPHMFRASKLVLVNKIDLLPHLDFDVERVVAAAREVNPNVEVIKISTKTGDGLQDWYSWLDSQLVAVRE